MGLTIVAALLGFCVQSVGRKSIFNLAGVAQSIAGNNVYYYSFVEFFFSTIIQKSSPHDYWVQVRAVKFIQIRYEIHTYLHCGTEYYICSLILMKFQIEEIDKIN